MDSVEIDIAPGRDVFDRDCEHSEPCLDRVTHDELNQLNIDQKMVSPTNNVTGDVNDDAPGARHRSG